MKKTNAQKLYEYICQVYGSKPFTTEMIYQSAGMLGINPNSIGGALNDLKKKGLLYNYDARETQTGRIQKTWQLV